MLAVKPLISLNVFVFAVVLFNQQNCLALEEVMIGFKTVLFTFINTCNMVLQFLSQHGDESISAPEASTSADHSWSQRRRMDQRILLHASLETCHASLFHPATLVPLLYCCKVICSFCSQFPLLDVVSDQKFLFVYLIIQQN